MTRVPDPRSAEEARGIAAEVRDPELPMVNLADLGILRRVECDAAGTVTVTVTPTYAGCPAMDAIRDDIRAALAEHGYTSVEVRTELTPAWSTDRITPEGRRKLAEHGIAPPTGAAPAGGGRRVGVELSVRCPHCGSLDTREVSRFGSTACKALYSCGSCREPFDHVKPL
ncbi:ring-1,2-phenylacetyl-CoA epoxidase subunit PaaD [Haloactinospora alba]|uniref:Ring-1,2-phenylacetyl-CoA epoxidase subunit PaaD n=1 Tax=Haloactinospora alba TaxID=405555 RepID=A0A543N7P6_9ACTN|nr:1,2-phenylacetyl-CoA epoxidase subunit PaaD [Haloactinospora alba]TQN27855.1 ring-1,2-phenylacetyl-CoA epoxidase subunit PaaD [Haloactinospora alba]